MGDNISADLNKDFQHIISLIQSARVRALAQVNQEPINLYFETGKFISEKVESATWGSGIVDSLAQFIRDNHPEIKGFTRRGFYRMKQFYEAYKNHEKVSALPAQFKDSGIFKDKYIFEFLSLPKHFSESDLQKSLVANLKDFILELGKGFSFIGDEYRVEVGNHDYYIDLLFYRRDLQCLVAVELKIEDFKPEFLGKMNFYLEALDREFKKEHENPSVGILLCKGKDAEVVEFAMARNISPTLIADYETRLIDKQLLRDKLHELLEMENKIVNNDS